MKAVQLANNVKKLSRFLVKTDCFQGLEGFLYTFSLFTAYILTCGLAFTIEQAVIEKEIDVLALTE